MDPTAKRLHSYVIIPYTKVEFHRIRGRRRRRAGWNKRGTILVAETSTRFGLAVQTGFKKKKNSFLKKKEKKNVHKMLNAGGE